MSLLSPALSQCRQVSPHLCTHRADHGCVAIALDSRAPFLLFLKRGVLSFCLDCWSLEFGFVSVLNMKTLKEKLASLPSRAGGHIVNGPALWPLYETDDPARVFYLIRTMQTSCKTRSVICCRGKRLLFFESGTSCNSSTTHDADSPSFAHILSTICWERCVCVCVCLVCVRVRVCVYGLLPQLVVF